MRQSLDLKYNSKDAPDAKKVGFLSPACGDLPNFDKHFWVTLGHSNAKLNKSVAARTKKPMLLIREDINSYIRPSLYDQVRG